MSVKLNDHRVGFVAIFVEKRIKNNRDNSSKKLILLLLQ